MIIFGLGNPGIKYRLTRHNAGFMVLDRLAKKYHKRFSSAKGYKHLKLTIANQDIKLIKPMKFMNNSGIVVTEVLKKYPEEFLVVLDDIALPLGRLRLRKDGSDGGHLGLRSIIEFLNTKDFPRLRIGIGPVSGSTKVYEIVDYVLANFESWERKILKPVIERAITGIEILIKEDFLKAQNYINSTSAGAQTKI